MTLLIHNLVVVASVTRQEMTLKMQQKYRKVRSRHVSCNHRGLLVDGIDFLERHHTSDVHYMSFVYNTRGCPF